MIPTGLPKLNKEQTEQLINDLNRPATKAELDFWSQVNKKNNKLK